MNRKQFIFTLSVALLSGLMGGVLSIWFLMPPSVLAQDGPPKVIEARAFRVVDEDGNARINIFPGGIAMHDSQRNTRFHVYETDVGAVVLYLSPKVGEKQAITIAVSDAASGFGPLARMWANDVNGKEVWSAP